MSFIGFVHYYGLNNRATTNINRYQVCFSIGLDNVDIYPRDEPSSGDVGIVSLHPSKGTHWATYINENYFDRYGCLSKRTI